jgi:hypothetical protein
VDLWDAEHRLARSRPAPQRSHSKEGFTWQNHDTDVAFRPDERGSRVAYFPASPRAFASAASSLTENPGVWQYSSVPCVP